MSWDKEPPKASELKAVKSVEPSASGEGWDAAPPTELEIQNISPESEKGLSGYIMDGVIAAGEAVDSYTGAPTRAAISAAQSGENPLTAFAGQFGEDPRLAPTGKQIVTKAGLDDKNPLFSVSGKQITDAVSNLIPGSGIVFNPLAKSTGFDKATIAPTTADVAGLGVDVLADPTLVVPFGAVTKAAKLTGTAAKGAAGAAAKVAAGAVKATPIVGDAAKVTARSAEIISESAKNTSKALSKMFKPAQADDFKELSLIAEKNGIAKELLPESVEFGPNSVITRAARNRAEGVLGEEHLNKFNEGLEAVRDATEKKIYSIGGGSAPDRIEAGEIIRQGFDRGVDDFFSKVDVTHNKIMEAIPGLGLAPESLEKIGAKVNGIEKWAKGRAMRGFTDEQRAQAEQVLRAIEAIRNGSGSYKQTVEALRDIGEVAFKSKNSLASVPPDIAKFRELYFTLDDALIDTVGKAAGAPVAEELRATNKAISEFLGEKSSIAGHIGNKGLSPEKLFSTLIENGDTRKIEALKKILPKEDFQKIKGAFLASQVKKNADEVFTFKGLHNSLRNKKDLLGSILDPNEIEELGEIIRLGSRFGEPVLSTSGTGASSLFGDITKGIRSGIESDALIGTLKNKARAPKELPAAEVSSLKKLPKSSSLAPKKTSDSLGRLAKISPIAARSIYSQDQKNKDSKSTLPIRGEKKWTVEGFANVLDHDPSGPMKNEKFVEKVMASPSGRRALILASDLRPGSKAMDQIYIKLKKEFGEKNEAN